MPLELLFSHIAVLPSTPYVSSLQYKNEWLYVAKEDSIVIACTEFKESKNSHGSRSGDIASRSYLQVPEAKSILNTNQFDDLPAVGKSLSHLRELISATVNLEQGQEQQPVYNYVISAALVMIIAIGCAVGVIIIRKGRFIVSCQPANRVKAIDEAYELPTAANISEQTDESISTDITNEPQTDSRLSNPTISYLNILYPGMKMYSISN
ncbi:uncharacterized protein LOC126847612 [Adelges cooleyi]|uniref:uncharacterized protein LOC126847612 n=1 Tax=Adelges cooleyi TaxID=133065 RepID=UPI00218088F4|nr:uncharacterized protein LOC126847612 [Adelges cooleyi]